ncbi:MAG: CAP domain-containing protein [Myxococcales bacterium]|nr:CAP domain-containing protein [Myxococcales bacterium]
MTHLLAAALLALSPADLESAAEGHLAAEFERLGRATPQKDAALKSAAQALAREALSRSVADAADLLTITGAVSDAGGFDPSPRALVVRGTPRDEPRRSFLERKDLADEPATHAGVGAAVDGERAAVVALLAHRKVSLLPFPRSLPAPGNRKLCGELAHGYARSELYVTRPSGSVDKLSSPAKANFCELVAFPQEGRHVVEVIAAAERGPEVAALFFVQVGAPSKRSARAAGLEPTDAQSARSEIIDRINALRAGSGVAPVARDMRLDLIAQAYSDQMAEQGFFGHVAPDGMDLRARLVRGGYPYDLAAENLGLASGPLAAHFAVEHSPGHRRNLIDPTYSLAGVGVTFRKGPDRSEAIIAEVLASPQKPPADFLAEAYRAVHSKREALGLPRLERSEALESIARAHVEKALSLDEPRTALQGEQIHERVFAALEDVSSVAVDFFVAAHPSLVTDSKNLSGTRVGRLGIAALKGDSPRFGKGNYWVVVIYATAR